MRAAITQHRETGEEG